MNDLSSHNIASKLIYTLYFNTLTTYLLKNLKLEISLNHFIIYFMEYSTKRKGIIIISCVAATAIVGVTVLWVINKYRNENII